jgi:hypothetical protein
MKLDLVAMSPEFDQDHTLMGVAGSDVHISRDGGDHWGRVGSTPAGKGIYLLSPAPLFEKWNVLFVLADDHTLYRSADGGKSWDAVLNIPYPIFVDPLVVPWQLVYVPDIEVNRPVFLLVRIRRDIIDPLSERVMLYRSRDGGLTWQEVELPEDVSPTALAISPNFAQDGLLFVGTADGRVLTFEDWTLTGQIGITPGTLTLSAGDSACFNVSALANWDGETLPSWSVYGLPTGATAEFKGQTAGNPTDGCLQIDTPCSTSEGKYPLEVTAAVPGKMWKAQVTLEIAACEEFKPGVYTKSMDELISVIVAGKPDFINGLAVPLQVCCGSQPRKLKVTIESATSEAGTPLTTPPRFYLFYSLVRPAPDFINAHSDVSRNVERDYVINSGWSLEGTVTPGPYLLVFEHDSYADLVYPRQPRDVPKSVTYRLEVVPMPCTETVCLRAFTVSPQTVNPGEMVTLSWDVAGEVQQVTLWTINSLGQLDTAHSDLPASGSLALTVPDWRRNAMYFQLYASDPDGLWIFADTSVKIACPDVWFFPNPPSDCPGPATYTKMAVQRFEHGMMIWTEWEDRIRVFYNDSQDVHLRRWEMRNNEWFPGMPESDPNIVPPPGYYQPVRGFGKLWREGLHWDGTSIHELLGWAIEPEFAIDHGAVQCDTSPKYNTCYLGDPLGVVYVEEPELQGWYEWAGPNPMP